MKQGGERAPESAGSPSLPDQSFISTLSTSPLTLCADVRRGPDSACFLYLPRDKNDLVIAASLLTLQKISSAVTQATESPLADSSTPYVIEPVGRGLGIVAARAAGLA